MKPESVTSFKVGLSNIRNRYEFFTDDKIQVIDQKEFIVKLPLLTHNIDPKLKIEQVA